MDEELTHKKQKKITTKIINLFKKTLPFFNILIPFLVKNFVDISQQKQEQILKLERENQILKEKIQFLERKILVILIFFILQFFLLLIFTIYYIWNNSKA